MAFHVLRPELTEYLLEGEVDELSEPAAERLEKIKRSPCPRCGAALAPRLNTMKMFSEHSPLPRLLATCACGFEQDYETGLIIDRGKATKVEDPLPIIRVDKE